MNELSKIKCKKNILGYELIKGASLKGKYDFPFIKATDVVTTELSAVPFCEISRESNTEQWVHFFIDDYRFERLWNNPQKYLISLKKLKGVITTDFSIYTDMPKAMQIWNVYRNRVIAYWLQNNGIEIIPAVSWSDELSFDFCFEAIETGGTIAISSNGCIKNKQNKYNFLIGLEELVNQLKPSTIVNCGNLPKEVIDNYAKKHIKIILIETYSQWIKRRLKNGR